MNLGIFLPNWIGDVVMATPTLRALRRQFPEARMIGIMRPYVAEVLAGNRWLDETVLYDHRGRDRARGTWGVARKLRARRLDTVVLLPNSWRSGLLAWLSGAPERVGFARGGRGCLLTKRLVHRRESGKFVPTPVLDDYLRLASAVGCPPESPQLELQTTADDERQADLVWSRLGLSAGEPVVVLNSGGAFGAAKLWPSEYFAQLARRLTIQHSYPVLVVCGPGERLLARDIVREAGHPRVVSLADQALGIGLTKACIRRARLLVTTDSGPRHFAAALAVPTVTLFGPTHIAWSENYSPQASHLQLALDCQPCQQRVCPLGHHRCMRDLTVDRVYAVVLRALAQEHVAHAA